MDGSLSNASISVWKGGTKSGRVALDDFFLRSSAIDCWAPHLDFTRLRGVCIGSSSLSPSHYILIAIAASEEAISKSLLAFSVNRQRR